MRSMRAHDTSAAAHAAWLAHQRARSPAARAEAAAALSEEVFAVTRAGIAARHPDYSPDQVRWAELRLRHGDDLFTRAWPRAPRLAP